MANSVRELLGYAPRSTGVLERMGYKSLGRYGLGAARAGKWGLASQLGMRLGGKALSGPVGWALLASDVLDLANQGTERDDELLKPENRMNMMLDAFNRSEQGVPESRLNVEAQGLDDLVKDTEQKQAGARGFMSGVNSRFNHLDSLLEGEEAIIASAAKRSMPSLREMYYASGVL